MCKMCKKPIPQSWADSDSEPTPQAKLWFCSYDCELVSALQPMTDFINYIKVKYDQDN